MKRMLGGLVMVLCLMVACALAQEAAGSALMQELPYRMGDVSEVIRDIKEKLFEVGYTDGLMQASGAFSDEFDAPMRSAVLAFQKDHGLEQTGEVDKAMMDVLLPWYYERIDAAATGAIVLGSMGETVRQLQQDLAALGYYHGDITGHFGSLTESAVRAFQEANGLVPDGIAGTKTQQMIRSEAETMEGK